MKDEKAEKALIGAVVLLLAIIHLPFKGWVVAKLWFWFLVPAGLPTFSWVEGSAIVLIVSLLTFKYEKQNDKDMDWPTQLGRALALPIVSLFALLTGALLRAFIQA